MKKKIVVESNLYALPLFGDTKTHFNGQIMNWLTHFSGCESHTIAFYNYEKSAYSIPYPAN